MLRRTTRRRLRLASLTLAISLLALPVVSLAGGWVDDDAADTTADDIQDHEEGSDNPDTMTEGSRNPDQMTTDSGTMAGRMEGAKNPDGMVTGAAAMDDTSGDVIAKVSDNDALLHVNGGLRVNLAKRTYDINIGVKPQPGLDPLFAQMVPQLGKIAPDGSVQLITTGSL